MGHGCGFVLGWTELTGTNWRPWPQGHRACHEGVLALGIQVPAGDPGQMRRQQSGS